MKHSGALFFALILGSVFTISGYCIPNLQYHKQQNKTSRPDPKKTTKQATPKPKKQESSKPTTTQKDLNNPMQIQDGVAEEFP